MLAYLDTGLLVKLYTKEVDSDHILNVVNGLKLPIAYSSYQHAEFTNAVYVMHGRGLMTAGDARKAVNDVALDIEGEKLHLFDPDWNAVFVQTTYLSITHGPPTLCRSLDAIHVALAIRLNVTQFVTRDRRQATLAKLVG
jgi:predicted nucleic acid-binding protein